MSQTITQPDNTRITLEKSTDYRDTYANSVQVRLSLWDFFLIFGTIQPSASQANDEVTIQNFQGVYLSPQQAKALSSILAHNVAQYEQTFGTISLENTPADAPRFVGGKNPVH
jgi:hypothetical protein